MAAATASINSGDAVARAAGQPKDGAPRIAVVTGGSRGIGKEICLVLAEQGYTGVAINFRSDASRAKAEAVAAQVEASGAKALAVQADVSVEEDVERLFAEVDAKLGRVTALVNNAAILGNKEADLEKLGLDDLTRVLKVNVHGPFLCTRAASKRMSVRNGGKGGCIVNVSSGSALIGSPFCYGISKGALNSMQAGLVKDLAAKGIRINTVAPGMTQTEMVTDAMIQGNLKNIPMRRAGKPREIAEAVAWLLSDAASYCAGVNIRVAGGRPMGGLQ